MDYRKNVMATMAWTNEWLSSGHEDIKNKEFLFLIQKDKSAKPLGNFRVKKVNLREPAMANQQKLSLF